MSARSGFAEKNLPGAILGHPKPFFAWTEQIPKMQNQKSIFLGGSMGPIHQLLSPSQKAKGEPIVSASAGTLCDAELSLQKKAKPRLLGPSSLQ